jgi:hypothetical protein
LFIFLKGKPAEKQGRKAFRPTVDLLWRLGCKRIGRYIPEPDSSIFCNLICKTIIIVKFGGEIHEEV